MCDGLATFPWQFSQIFGAPPLFPPTSLLLQLFVNSQVAKQKLQRKKLPCVRRALAIASLPSLCGYTPYSAAIEQCISIYVDLHLSLMALHALFILWSVLPVMIVKHNNLSTSGYGI